jgi:hypothetical protein
LDGTGRDGDRRKTFGYHTLQTVGEIEVSDSRSVAQPDVPELITEKRPITVDKSHGTGRLRLKVKVEARRLSAKVF